VGEVLIDRVFQTDEKTTEVNNDPAVAEDKESIPEGHQETIGC
jgi:hypothetical protein